MRKIFIHYKWRLILLLFALIIAITLTVLPLVVQRMAVAWLEENGADRASIGDIDLNLFTGRLGVFDVKVEKAGAVPLRIWRLTADVDLWLLSRKRFFVKSVWLYEADLRINQHEDGSLDVGGIRILPESKTDTEPETKTVSRAFLDQWGVGLQSLGIRNSTIQYQSSIFDERLDIKSFYVLNAFSWQPDRPARINFDLLVNQKPVTLLSDARVFREAPDTHSSIRITQLDLSHFAPVAKHFGIDELQGLLSLSLDIDATYGIDKQAHFNLDANVDLDHFRVRQGELLVAHNTLHYQGKTTLNLPASAGQTLGSTTGQLVIQDQTVNVADLQARHTQLVWNGNTTVIVADDIEQPPLTKVQGNLEVAGLQVDDRKTNLKSAKVDKVVANDIAVNVPNDIAVGRFEVSDIKASLQTNSGLLDISLNQANVKSAQFNNEKQTATVAGMELTDLGAQLADQKIQLAQVQTIDVQQAAVDLQKSLSVNTVTVQGAQALKASATPDLPNPEPVVYVSRTTLDNMQYQFEPQSLALRSINIDGLDVLVKRKTDGSLYAVSLLPTTTSTANPEKPSSEPPPPAKDKSSAPLAFEIGQVNVGEDSKVRIVDHSVTPHFDANVAPLNISATQINSNHPGDKTRFELNTSLNPGNRITAKGWITPFADKRNADINAEIKALDLVRFSPYSVRAVGYQVRTGRINATIKGVVKADDVKANASLSVQRLNLDATSDAARGKSAQALGIGMPIDAALALMKDKNGNITIEVPVSGNLQDPNFALGPAFGSAMSQAIKKASITYAAYALQPYGSILLGAKMLSKITALRLKSVRFQPGQAELDDQAKNYLGKIAGLMKERPGINITLCGNATESDRKALKSRNISKLQEALTVLAEQRGDNVKNHLMNQHGISADRFFRCQPEVTSNEEAKPEVKLGL